ncbi:MAG: 4-(cytidine 5'-diphospho)-2-C-methyl-D-erythritol kinase [Candidatus Manganitrophaceae bacterium]|nr:MAG: 4-(cytidine 5'-diphospho)-2-C-methyl-D-erythritol kinase [Candidatus Manganitrophaceae bacterium]
MKKTVLIKAPAKVNLYLKVLGRREDGYHQILSLMQMVGLYDFLAFREDRSEIHLTVEDGLLPADRSNLIIRAAEALQGAASSMGERPKGASIRLTKQIPIAAGLGGGSSDAAATLIGLNRLWGLRWPRERLAQLGATLGSDVPFFLYGPTAWASGRGEQIEPAGSTGPGWMVLVNPGFTVSTAWVYQEFSRKLGLTKRGREITINKFIAHRPSLREIFHRPHNDLEEVTLEAFPQLTQIKKELSRLGGKGILMSGSGPTLFALFKEYASAKQAAAAFDQGGSVRSWVARVLKRSPV